MAWRSGTARSPSFVRKSRTAPRFRGVGYPPDISPVFEVPYRPGYRSLVRVVVPDKGILRDVLRLRKEHQDGELPSREARLPEPVVEEGEFAAVNEGNDRPGGDIVRQAGFHINQ
jgi:hypothetical protein